MNTITIQLTDLRFYGYHGVMPLEAQVGNEFGVDVELDIPAHGLEQMVSENKEDLELTISYADVFDIVKEEMGRRCELLETLAIRTARRITDKWPRIIGGRLRITKIAPPIPGCNGPASVTYTWTNP